MILLDDTISSEDAMPIVDIANVANSFDAPMIALEEEIGTHLDSPMLHDLQNHDEIDIAPLPQPCVQLPPVRKSFRKSSFTPNRQEEMLQKGSKADCIEAAVWCGLRIFDHTVPQLVSCQWICSLTMQFFSYPDTFYSGFRTACAYSKSFFF